MARRTKQATVDEAGQQQGDPEVEAQASGDPGSCGETACWSRDPITFTQTNTARAYTFTPTGWKGGVRWDFGDGTSSKATRGPAKHTYTAAGTFTVKAAPVASSCFTVAAPLPLTVA
jgi:PKD domain